MNKTLKELIILLLIIAFTLTAGFFVVKFFMGIKSFQKKNEEVNINIEEKLKAILKKQISFEEKIIENKIVNSSFDRIKKRLTDNIKDNPYRIELIVVDSPLINAVCLPGGLIVVYSGLIDIADSAEEITAVIAHEMGHVIYRDSLNAIVRELGLALIMTVATGGDPNIGDKIVKMLISTKFSREIEKRADEFAAELLIKSGIKPERLSSVFKKLKAKEKSLVDNRVLTYLSTHPDIDQRIIEIDKKSELFRGKEDLLNINWNALKNELKKR